MTSAARIKAIETATGMEWDAWAEHLDGVGARDMTFKQIQSRAEEHMPLAVNDPAWWARQVSVAYEERIGRGLPGQRVGHTYEARERTAVQGNLNQAMAAWKDYISDCDSFAGSPLESEPTTTESATWRRWRAQLEDGTRVTIDIGLDGGKAVVTATHARLATAADVNERSQWWASFLSGLQDAERGSQ